MASGSKIIVTGEPKGVYLSGTIRTAAQPGIMCQIDVSEATVGGRFQYEPYDQAVSAQMGLVMILLPNPLGGIATAAYAAGDACELYCPLPGEEMNVLLQDVAGTADDFVVGDRLIVEDATGLFLATTGTAADKSEPFYVLEAITDPVADTLVHVQFTGY